MVGASGFEPSKAGTSGRFSLPWFLLERAETLEYWPIRREYTGRPVNQKASGFRSEIFGSANGIRTNVVSVNPVYQRGDGICRGGVARTLGTQFTAQE